MMLPPTELFRKEVLDQKINRAFGPVLINTVLSRVCVGWFLLIMVFVLLGYLLLAPYSEKISVQGYVDMKPGLIQIYPRRAGLIWKQLVAEGEIVKKGQVLSWIKTGFDQLQQDQAKIEQEMGGLEKALAKQIDQKKQQLTSIQQLFAKHYVSKSELLSHQQRLFQLQNDMTQLLARKIESHMGRVYAMLSPIDGVVSTISAQKGQWIREGQPVFQVMPLSSTCFVWLMVPVKAIRWIHLGQLVSLHYDAYPFFQFGADKGEVESLSRFVSSEKSLPVPISTHDPFYKVSVRLMHPGFFTQGSLRPLYQGMTLKGWFQTDYQPIWRKIFQMLATD